MHSVEAYVTGRGAVPSAAVANQLYLAVITSDKQSSLSRMKALYGLLKIQPTLGKGRRAKAQTLEEYVEYVRESIKATGQELPHKHPLHKYLEFARNPEEFGRRMSQQFGLLSGSDGYNPKNVAEALNYLRVSADKGIALPEDVSMNLPRHIVMALVHKNSAYTTPNRVRNILATLEGQGAYAVDKGEFQLAITEGLRLLAEESSGASGSRLHSIRMKSLFLTELSRNLNVGLTGQADSYLRQVDPKRYGTDADDALVMLHRAGTA